MAPLSSNRIESLLDTSITICSTSLSALSSPAPAASASTAAPPALTDIRNDLVSLLSLLGKEATALSLAFKPPISADAVEGTLEKLQALLVKLEFCLVSCAPRTGPLVKELRYVVVSLQCSGASSLTSLLLASFRPASFSTPASLTHSWIGAEAFESFQRLLESTLTYHLSPTSSSKTKDLRQQALNATGAVWEVVERGQGISVDELQAARKEWGGVLGLLDDCLEEVKEMLESGAEEEEDPEEEEEDEDEDDFRTSHPLGAEELERVKAAHLLLRLGRLLLNRLINSTASPSASLPGSSDPTFLPSAQGAVTRLSATADDFAASLEPPQEDMQDMVQEWVEVVKKLAEVVEKAAGEGSEGEGERKWCKVWREQFEVAERKLIALDEAKE